MAEPPSLAIVIVSFNVRAELEACLRSLAADKARGARSIIVVDNGSTDESVAMVRERFPAVHVIEAGGNIGYARANNLGIRASRTELVLLLNPDTILSAGSIDRLIGALAANPAAAAAGPRLVDGAGRPELSFGWTISPLGELRQKVVGALYQRGVTCAVQRVERWTRRSGSRDWISGACLLVRRADLDAVGLLDERYFMYTEDVDLAVALRRRGRQLIFVADVEVQHLRGRSAASNPQLASMRRRSQIAYYEKHHPAWVPMLKAFLWITGRQP